MVWVEWVDVFPDYSTLNRRLYSYIRVVHLPHLELLYNNIIIIRPEVVGG